MKPLCYILFSLFALLLPSCVSDDTILPVVNRQEGRVTITFRAESGIQTRTVLNSAEPLQHVSEVNLYVFKIVGADTLYTTKVNNIKWTDHSEGAKTDSTICQLTLDAASYCFLAVGLDPSSRETYAINDSWVANSTKFAEAKAVLATGKGKENIAVSELYAGWEPAVVQEGENEVIRIDLWRRVAGILGYFKNIPDEVKYIQVLLYEDQNSEVPLRKPTANNDAESGDHGMATLADSRILFSIDKTVDTYTYQDEKGNVVTAVRKGSYVLPKQAPTDPAVTHTLTIQTLKGNGIDVVKTYNISILSFVSGTNVTGVTVDKRKFPLFANDIYCLGSADEPIDLDENDIFITVNSNWLWVGDGDNELPIL